MGNKIERKLYNGKVDIYLNEGNHTYRVSVGGEKFKHAPSVTGITSGSNKDQLIWWAVNMAIGSIQENLKPGMVYDEVQIDEMLSDAKYAHTRKSKQAMTIGTVVHNWIEDYINLKINNKEVKLDYPINQMAKQAVLSFLEWIDANHVEFLASEDLVYSLSHGYAGKLDIKCVINGNLAIGDFKTSTGVYTDHLYQLSAYRFAKTEEDKQEYPGSFILHIPKDGGEVKPYYMTPEIYEHCFDGFLGLLALYRNSPVINKYLKSLKEATE
jgi:hypothetical protein